MDPLVGSALVSAGANALGNIFGAFGQKSSNASYLKGVRETNETNLNIAQQNNEAELQRQQSMNDWNLAQWNRENQYNTPLAQRNRLLMAGINGYSGSSGEASQLQAAQGNALQQAHMEAPGRVDSPLSSVGRAVGGSVDAYFNQMSKGQLIQQQGLQNQMLAVDAFTHLDKRLLELRKSYLELSHQQNINDEDKKRLSMLETDIKYYEDFKVKLGKQMDASFDNTLAGTRKLQSEANKVDSDIITQLKMLDLTEKETLQRIASMKASDQTNAFNAWTNRLAQQSSGEVNSAQVNKIAEEILNIRSETAMKQILERYADKIAKMNVVEKAVLLKRLGIQLEHDERRNDSWFGNGLEVLLGVDPNGLNPLNVVGKQ